MTYENKEVYGRGIELKELHQVIGSIGVVQTNFAIECVQIGYSIGKPWWCIGITSEAFLAVIQFFMEEVGIFVLHDISEPFIIN